MQFMSNRMSDRPQRHSAGLASSLASAFRSTPWELSSSRGEKDIIAQPGAKPSSQI